MDEWLAEPSVWDYHAPVPDSRIVTELFAGVAQRPCSPARPPHLHRTRDSIRAEADMDLSSPDR